MLGTLNTDEEQTLVQLLSRLSPGLLPYDIFTQVARLVALSIVEVVPLRYFKGRIQVLMIPRDASDQFWSNQLHTPGTVVRPTDTSELESVFTRIFTDELQGTPVGQPHFIGNRFRKSARGTEQAQIYWVEVQGEPVVGEFYDYDNLPDGRVRVQQEFIDVCVASFKKEIDSER
jgi:hypothetical protein